MIIWVHTDHHVHPAGASHECSVRAVADTGARSEETSRDLVDKTFAWAITQRWYPSPFLLSRLP